MVLGLVAALSTLASCSAVSRSCEGKVCPPSLDIQMPERAAVEAIASTRAGCSGSANTSVQVASLPGAETVVQEQPWSVERDSFGDSARSVPSASCAYSTTLGPPVMYGSQT